MKILCTGDVHIGRRSSRLPQSADNHANSAASAWLRIVDRAIAEEVDLLTISGDLVDQANRYFEAIGALERGLRRLEEADIVTLMVAGNHDHDILPLVADGFGSDSVRLLGRGGKWERHTIEKRGVRLHVDGWSFPQERFTGSPLAEYAPTTGDSTPTLALLHADLDQPRSPYGPVSVAELRRFSGTFFQLGHVHGVRQVNEPGGARALYPGSPQALDPGEPGWHGVFLVDVGPTGFAARPESISTVRYEQVTVPLDGVERFEEVDARIALAVKRKLEEIGGEDDGLRQLTCRVRLTGATRLHRELDARVQERVADLNLERGTASASVESVTIDTRPLRDVAALAQAQGPPGVLAKLLLELEGEAEGSTPALVEEALRAVRDIERANPYLEVIELGATSELDRRAAVEAELSRAAARLLDEILAQKELPA